MSALEVLRAARTESVFDAGVWYYLPVGDSSSLRFQLTVKNITDETWYVASDGDRFAPQCQHRSAAHDTTVSGVPVLTQFRT